MIDLKWLGRVWEEVRRELEQTGVSYITKLTQAPGEHSAQEQKYRIVRLREIDSILELTLAKENVPDKLSSTP